MVYQKNLLVLKFWDEYYHAYHIQEFKKMFQSVHVINYDARFAEDGISGTERYINEFIERENIHIVIVWLFLNNYELSLEYLNSIRKKASVVLWFFDDELFFQSFNKFYAQIADAVVTSSYYERYSYEQMDIPSVLYISSYSKQDYFPMDVEKKIDVSFVGVSEGRPERTEYIEYLNNNGINVATYGLGFSGGFVPQEKMNEIFNMSKINLNFTQMNRIAELYKENPLLNRIRQSKGRPIEIALTKSFCLSQSAPSMDKLFEIDKEIVVFDTKEELLEKVQYYLKHLRERERITLNAYKRAIRQYESRVYLQNVFNELFNKLEKNRKRRFMYGEIYCTALFYKKKNEFLLRSLEKWISSWKFYPVRETVHNLRNENGNIMFLIHIMAKIVAAFIFSAIRNPVSFFKKAYDFFTRCVKGNHV
jgi:spore maturation protein CgeB